MDKKHFSFEITEGIHLNEHNLKENATLLKFTACSTVHWNKGNLNSFLMEFLEMMTLMWIWYSYFKSVSRFTRTREKINCPGQELAEKLWLLTCCFPARLVTPVLLVTISVFSTKRLKSFWFRKSLSKKRAKTPQENKINIQRHECLCHGEPAQEFFGSANSWIPESAAKIDTLPPEPLLSP